LLGRKRRKGLGKKEEREVGERGGVGNIGKRLKRKEG
jgi:hypothetical protein